MIILQKDQRVVVQTDYDTNLCRLVEISELHGIAHLRFVEEGRDRDGEPAPYDPTDIRMVMV